MTIPSVAAVVLAAGHGKRMRSKYAKVLHHVSGRPMIDHLLDTVASVEADPVIVVTGHDEERVRAHVGARPQVQCVSQHEQLGTGHAVMQAEPNLKGFQGLVLITYGDAPLWRPDTIRGALARASDPKISGVVLTARLEDPTGYGRVIRDHQGHVQKIVEQRDATEDEARVAEINSGTYAFKSAPLFEALAQVTNTNAQGEYYLTDVIEILIRKGHRILAHIIDDYTEAMGVNSRRDLADAEIALQRRTLNRLLEQGVTIVDPKSAWIDSRVQIGQDSIIYPNTVLRGNTVIGEECRIGPNTELIDARIGEGAVIRHSVIEGHEVGPDTEIGPYATLVGGRRGTRIAGNGTPSNGGSKINAIG